LRCRFATVSPLHCSAPRAKLVTPHAGVHYGENPSGWGVRGRSWTSSSGVVTDFDVDRPTIEKASGIILDFLTKEGPPGKVRALPAKLPGAQGLNATRRGRKRRWRHGRGDGRGHAPSGRAEHGEAQDITRQSVAYARGKAGEAEIGQLVGAIPGLSQFV